MGNSSSKDGRPSSRHDGRHAHHHGDSSQHHQDSTRQASARDQELANQIYGAATRGGGFRRSSQNLAFLHIGGGSSSAAHREAEASDRPRETKPERDARRAERDRQARLRERERSVREESVDGGFLVTLGTYTGPEDFNKGIVRQLQIERRLAPFWKGLEDHSDAWTEAQLIAAARGLPIPAPDEVPPEMEQSLSQASASVHPPPESQAESLTVPIPSRSFSQQSDASTSLSAPHSAFSMSGPSTPSGGPLSSSPLFRSRAKTLASLAGSAESGRLSQPDVTLQEIRLPHEPTVNGTPLEAVLYKDASECPICFLYYPPYLNHTRCCGQDICSECFVQIKRPDPHPPEHEQPGQPPRNPEEEAGLLVSEIAACPFCVTPEFGVTYEPPPFRRGLAYASPSTPLSALRNATSAVSSTTSLTPSAGSGAPLSVSPSSAMRRRATSLSATAPNVITTDRVRPDWAKKLADARAQALRRSAAATALHTAAYMLGSDASGSGHGSSRSALRLGGRSRRMILVDSIGNRGALPRIGDGNESGSQADGASGRQRVGRVEDLEELMMLEAIRQSLLAEEERKSKSESEAAKSNEPSQGDSSQQPSESRLEARDDGSASSLSLSPSPSPAASASSQQHQDRSGSNAGVYSESSAFLTVPTSGAGSSATSAHDPTTSSSSSASTSAAPDSKVSFRSLAAMVDDEDQQPAAASSTHNTNG
jgi:hypothetical protein